MKKLIFAFLLISSASWAQTQTELNQQAHKKYQRVDRELNDVYRQIMNLYKSDSSFIQNLKSSQRIWIQFRDAELKVKYPDRESAYYGSIYSMCEANYLKELTEMRIDRLKTWLNGVEEGDVCSGSIVVK